MIAICPNPYRDADLNYTRRAMKMLAEEGIACTICPVFAEDGEDFFRALEHRAATEAGKQSGKIIATGGGIVTREENFGALRQNGTVVFIERDINALSRDGRPLSTGADLGQMYEKRLPMYKYFCDVQVSNDSTVDECVSAIIKAIKEDLK